MFSHVTMGTDDLARATRFYDAVLAPLGLKRRTVQPDGGPAAACWVGPRKYPRFYVYEPFNDEPASAGNGAMVAFIAPDRAAVDDAHAAGMAFGGANEGAPGLRQNYAPDYYGAYLRDPDGNKLHIVYRQELASFR